MEELYFLLRTCSQNELAGFYKLLNLEIPTPNAIVIALNKCSTSLYGKLTKKQNSYKDILIQAANKMKINIIPDSKTSEIELTILQQSFRKIWADLPKEKREELEKEIYKSAREDNNMKKIISASGVYAALTAAQLSGFGIYLLASTILGGLSSIIGITLPFAIYTAMSHSISIIIGPVGWIGLGVFALWKIFGPKYKKLHSSIIYISMIRYEKINKYIEIGSNYEQSFHKAEESIKKYSNSITAFLKVKETSKTIIKKINFYIKSKGLKDSLIIINKTSWETSLFPKIIMDSYDKFPDQIESFKNYNNIIIKFSDRINTCQNHRKRALELIENINERIKKIEKLNNDICSSFPANQLKLIFVSIIHSLYKVIYIFRKSVYIENEKLKIKPLINNTNQLLTLIINKTEI